MVTASVFAHARGIPVHGVCSLDALAHEAARTGAVEGEFVVATDARRKEVYWARYAAVPGEGGAAPRARRLTGPAVDYLATVGDAAEGAPVVGRGAHPTPTCSRLRPGRSTSARARWPRSPSTSPRPGRPRRSSRSTCAALMRRPPTRASRRSPREGLRWRCARCAGPTSRSWPPSSASLFPTTRGPRGPVGRSWPGGPAATTSWRRTPRHRRLRGLDLGGEVADIMTIAWRRGRRDGSGRPITRRARRARGARRRRVPHARGPRRQRARPRPLRAGRLRAC